MIAGWISGEDLEELEAANVGDCWDGSRGLEWIITASADNICPLEMFAMSHLAALLLSLGVAKLVRRNLICIPKTVLFIMRYP